jgi:UDPglucose 6-dehydrogenase
MKVAIIGTGYVGLVTGTCLSELGNEVLCVDVDKNKIEGLKQGHVPIYEPGLDAMIRENVGREQLGFTTELEEALKKSNICFIAVGTPMGEDGSADLSYVIGAAREIGQKMEHHLYVVDKSTVPVGSSEKVRRAIQEELDKRNSKLTFDVISNPEFLKEGNAVQDSMRPDRIVIGTDHQEAEAVMRELYKGFVINTNNIITMDLASAEMTKYAANSMLATKISFINEIANICELVGANINKVRMGIGSDRRIGYSFIYAGCGYGGSCFPKDVRALISTAETMGYQSELLKAVEAVNSRQKMVLVNKIIRRFGEHLEGKSFGIWGLAFKPETNDMREATAITVIKELVKRGASVKAYDPKAIMEAKDHYLKDITVEYVKSKYSALNNVDAMILITEWAEFRNPDFFEMSQRMKDKVIFDGRNQYDPEVIKKYGFEYYQIGA